MIKAVLFDMDGILYDSERFYMDITVRVMRSLGYTGPEESLYAVVGTTAKGTWKILYDLLE
jgi:beta-phosphoglucomutase-like phosphatase (HAD superfamily)